MKIRRFFVENEITEGRVVSLTGEEANHMIKVLRLPLSSIVEIINGNGIIGTAIIQDKIDHPPSVYLKIVAVKKVDREIPEIHMGLGLVKRNQLADIVRIATELEISALHLLNVERSVPIWKKKRLETVLERLTKISISALKQSCNPFILNIYSPKSLLDFVAIPGKDDICLLLDHQRSDVDLCNLSIRYPGQRIFLLIGPEGGFTMHEQQLATSHGFKPISIAPSILRTTTCVLAISSLLVYHFSKEKKVMKSA